MPDHDAPAKDRRDSVRLARICAHFLHSTHWAGDLGDPMPRHHKTAKDKRFVTELRHERRVAAETVARHPQVDR